MTVEPGCLISDLEKYLALKGRQLRLLPSTWRTASIGGFIAGIMTSIGIVLQWVAFGTKEALKRFNWKGDNVFMVGLLISTLTGLFGYFSNGFLKSSIYKINLVLIGEIKIFTAFIFDVGVYLVVVGVLMFIFTNFCSDKP